MDASRDPFDGLLDLEEQYYKEGYEDGFRDGAEAGRREGYSLGLTKGFEKFVEAGRLQGKAVVWANRIPKYQQRRQQRQQQQQQQQRSQQNVSLSLSSMTLSEEQRRGGTAEITTTVEKAEEAKEGEEGGGGEGNETLGDWSEVRLPPIASSARLERNVEMLYGLVEPGTLSTANDDEAVNDFDSRLKGARGKLRVIERAVGGEGARPGKNAGVVLSSSLSSLAPLGKNENIEEIGRIRSTGEGKLTDI
ncbi:putative duf1715 domain-containing protein [Rosellinia necatrix]|uniref:Putative duf1715 domain-containing protein n=1 Tax=Rosellinia necatrix TaxID=77044 RepID=A0A1W2TD40_ROSNE|nr:putative duf1715 domain-containing protein [Rosellinia necatrix]